MHIVGLGIDYQDTQLLDGLQRVHALRIERARRIAEKLEKKKVEAAWDGPRALAGTDAITRTHFARHLVSTGHARDMQQAFKKWLGHKGKAYVSVQWIGLSEAVSLISAAGGQAVIAHPGRYRVSRVLRDELIKDFKAAGGAGLEVSCSSHDPGIRRQMAELVRQHELLASVGSDFHAPGLSHIELGYNLALPNDLTPIWSDWNLQ